MGNIIVKLKNIRCSVSNFLSSTDKYYHSDHSLELEFLKKL